MKLTAVQTPTLSAGDDLLQVIAAAVPELPEQSVLVVTSKVVALWENATSVAVRSPEEKQRLINQESEWYTLPTSSNYAVSLTIRDGNLGVNAGIDESNVAEGFVLLPQDAYASAKRIWEFLRSHYGVAQVGVITTDSVSLPLKWGVVGRCIGHCGFKALKSRVGEEDLFKRKITMTQMAIAEGLASAAVFAMGEVAESTPLCLIESISHIEFQDRPPTTAEIAALRIDPADDVYAPLITTAPWKKGGRTSHANKKSD